MIKAYFPNSWALITNTFSHSTSFPSGQCSTSWLDWIFIKTLPISDDTRASAFARHMHKMCINMVLFLSQWCGEWMFIGHLMESIPWSGHQIACNLQKSLWRWQFTTCMTDSYQKLNGAVWIVFAVLSLRSTSISIGKHSVKHMAIAPQQICFFFICGLEIS